MPSTMDLDYYCIEPWLSPIPLTYTSPLLHECDIELLKKSLQLIIDFKNKQAYPIPEFEQLVYAVNNYIKECNNVFLASEHIRNFLLLGLFSNLLITLIVLVSIPVTPLSISLFCFASLVLFAVNLFTLHQQTRGFDQEDAKKALTKCHKKFKEILNSKNLKSHLIDKQQKIHSPTSTLCLFPAQKISQNDELEQSINENSLNDPENFPPPHKADIQHRLH